MKRIALKVDCDTYVGTSDGVPRLLEAFDARGIRATFFFSYGPDRSGVAIKRVFTRPGFLSKMLRSGGVSLYGFPTILYGTFLASPMIGQRCAPQMRAAARAGHEVAVHAWDHVGWHDHVDQWSIEKIREESGRAHEEHRRIFLEPARAGAAAGWACNEKSLAVEAERSLLDSADARRDAGLAGDLSRRGPARPLPRPGQGHRGPQHPRRGRRPLEALPLLPDARRVDRRRRGVPDDGGARPRDACPARGRPGSAAREDPPAWAWRRRRDGLGLESSGPDQGEPDDRQESQGLEYDAAQKGSAIVRKLDAVAAGGDGDREVPGVGDEEGSVSSVHLRLPRLEVGPAEDQVSRLFGLDRRRGLGRSGSLDFDSRPAGLARRRRIRGARKDHVGLRIEPVGANELQRPRERPPPPRASRPADLWQRRAGLGKDEPASRDREPGHGLEVRAALALVVHEPARAVEAQEAALLLRRGRGQRLFGQAVVPAIGPVGVRVEDVPHAERCAGRRDELLDLDARELDDARG